MRQTRLLLLGAQLLSALSYSVQPQVPLLKEEIRQEMFGDDFDINLSETRLLSLGLGRKPVLNFLETFINDLT